MTGKTLTIEVPWYETRIENCSYCGKMIARNYWADDDFPDDKFCEQIEREWTVTKLLAYLRNADRSLQDRAEQSLESASTFLAAAASGNEKPS